MQLPPWGLRNGWTVKWLGMIGVASHTAAPLGAAKWLDGEMAGRRNGRNVPPRHPQGWARRIFFVPLWVVISAKNGRTNRQLGRTNLQFWQDKFAKQDKSAKVEDKFAKLFAVAKSVAVESRIFSNFVSFFGAVGPKILTS